MFENNVIHIIVLVDVSYSMSSHIYDFVYALNKLLVLLKNNSSIIYRITLAEFNTQLNFIKTFEHIDNIQEFTKTDFHIDGTTALYDAICNTIKYVIRKNNIVMYKTKMFIISDGDDNASFIHNKEDTDKLTNEMIEYTGWEIIHCNTDSNLLNIPFIKYDINDISNIFDNLHI